MPSGIYKRKPFTEKHKKALRKASTITGFQTGHTTWNKGMKFGPHSDELKNKISKQKAISIVV